MLRERDAGEVQTIIMAISQIVDRENKQIGTSYVQVIYKLRTLCTRGEGEVIVYN